VIFMFITVMLIFLKKHWSKWHLGWKTKHRLYPIYCIIYSR